MLQIYSTNIDVVANAPFALSNIVINKGCGVQVVGNSLQFNRRGIYRIDVDGYGTGSAAGTDTVNLTVSGIATPQALTSFTTAESTINNFGFTTFIVVSTDSYNCGCSYTIPTTAQIINGDIALTGAHINITVSRV